MGGSVTSLIRVVEGSIAQINGLGDGSPEARAFGYDSLYTNDARAAVRGVAVFMRAVEGGEAWSDWLLAHVASDEAETQSREAERAARQKEKDDDRARKEEAIRSREENQKVRGAKKRAAAKEDQSGVGTSVDPEVGQGDVAGSGANEDGNQDIVT